MGEEVVEEVASYRDSAGEDGILEWRRGVGGVTDTAGILKLDVVVDCGDVVSTSRSISAAAEVTADSRSLWDVSSVKSMPSIGRRLGRSDVHDENSLN